MFIRRHDLKYRKRRILAPAANRIITIIIIELFILRNVLTAEMPILKQAGVKHNSMHFLLT
jgi:hypothetical protein